MTCLKYGLGIRLIQSALGDCSTTKVRVTVLEISVPPTQGFHLQERESLTCFRRQHKSQTALVCTTQGEPTLWKSLTEPKASILLASILTSLILLVGLSLWLAVNLNSPSTFSQTSNLLIAKMRCLWDLIFCIKEAKRPSIQYHYVYLETAHPFLGK